MERPNSSGSGSPQVLHLLACKKVPVGAEQVWGPKRVVIHDRHWTHHRITNRLQRQGPIASLINSRQLTESSSHALWPPFSMPGIKIPLAPSQGCCAKTQCASRSWSRTSSSHEGSKAASRWTLAIVKSGRRGTMASARGTSPAGPSTRHAGWGHKKCASQ